jgi:hypothetical protein
MNLRLMLLRSSSLGLVFYLIVACLSTWPLLKSFSTRLPIGTEPCRTVPMFNLWTLEWNVQSFNNGTLYWSQEYWDAPIFFPANDSFAMSEAQPILGLLAPIVWMTGSTIAAYNSYIILSLALNGWFTRKLLVGQDFPYWISTLAGGGMVLLPVAHWQLGVSQLVPIWGIIWSWDVILRWLKPSKIASTSESTSTPESETTKTLLPNGTLKDAMELSGAWIATFAMSVHHGLFAAVIYGVAIFTLVLLKLRDLKILKRAALVHAITAVSVGLLIGPMLWRHHRVSQENCFEREASLVEQLSVWPSQYLTTYGHSISNWIVGHGWATQTGWTIGAGLLTTVIAIFGLLIGMFAKAHRHMSIVLLLVSAVSFLFSMGNHASLGNWSAWDGLVNYVPGFSQVRSAYRFIYFLQIAIVLAAAIGIHWIASGKPLWRTWTAAGLAILCTIDPWPCSVRLGATPSSSEMQASWAETLRSQPMGGVVILPLLDGGTVHDYEIVTEWMLKGLYAEKPLVNGYSGFFPKPQLDLAKRIYQAGLNRETVEELNRLGVRYIVVSPFNQIRIELDQSGLEIVESRQDNWLILRIPPSPIPAK